MTEAQKHDTEKVRLDLMPVRPILELGKVLTYGGHKYGDRNWEQGLLWSRPYAAALRHLYAWFSGETVDQETGLNHLAHAMCNIAFLLEYEHTHPELDDRPGSIDSQYNVEAERGCTDEEIRAMRRERDVKWLKRL